MQRRAAPAAAGIPGTAPGIPAAAAAAAREPRRGLDQLRTQEGVQLRVAPKQLRRRQRRLALLQVQFVSRSDSRKSVSDNPDTYGTQSAISGTESTAHIAFELCLALQRSCRGGEPRSDREHASRTTSYM